MLVKSKQTFISDTINPDTSLTLHDVVKFNIETADRGGDLWVDIEVQTLRGSALEITLFLKDKNAALNVASALHAMASRWFEELIKTAQVKPPHDLDIISAGKGSEE
jgi:hypothetical protein